MVESVIVSIASSMFNNNVIIMFKLNSFVAVYAMYQQRKRCKYGTSNYIDFIYKQYETNMVERVKTIVRSHNLFSISGIFYQ